MLPVLLDLRHVKIYTFGVFLVLAFFWSTFVLWKNIRLTSHKEEEIFDGMFYSLVGGLFFSRVVHVVLNFDKFGFDFLKFILINGYPGLSLYGALFGMWGSLYIFFMLRKINFRSVSDYFVTPIFIALIFGKLGSFFSGIEVGTKTKFVASIKYFGYDGFRHLTPLYESILFCLGAYLSYRLIFAIRKGTYKNGFAFSFFCWYFALVYIMFDKLKANPLYLVPLKIGQESITFNFLISGIMLLIFSIYFLYYFRNSLINYGKPAFKKIAKGFSGGVRDRNQKVGKADSGSEKK